MAIKKGVIELIFNNVSSTNKFKGVVNGLSKKLSVSSLDVLKKDYKVAHYHYLNLSNNNKKKYSSHLLKLREHIGEVLVREKTIETLLAESSKGTFASRKNKFNQIMKHFNHLPQGEKDKFNSQIMHLKEQLGRGRV